MAEEEGKKSNKEGNNLLGSPTFTHLQTGRFKCVETGHEMLDKDKESYSQSKRCRIGLIDYALANNKTPLNMFKQDPAISSKLICKLTGDTVNKSEEHIWKHINGKRFLNKLEQKELGIVEEKKPENSKHGVDGGKKKKKEMNKKKDKKEKPVEEIVSEMRDSSDKDSEVEDIEFWMPPDGERWDFDDGGDRWGSDEELELEEETEEANRSDDAVEENGESEELSKRTKRMSIEIGPSSFASRKKKSKKNSTN
ncbi:protein PXR1-like isoform X2 [Mercurialis annua]|uniref:protein PXR1-like isoform X2 n=1 Tax=Mercurialis annua TaxID=3986 RepID=UPI00215F5508|nr:protein PXR1-like isoform X2 [Mercurialis annua]